MALDSINYDWFIDLLVLIKNNECQKNAKNVDSVLMTLTKLHSGI